MTRQLTMIATLACLGVSPLGAQQPASPHGQLRKGLDCSACHTVEGWKPVRSPMAFTHASTGFPLTGRHAAATCAECHLQMRFDEPRASANECAACHLDIHRGRLGSDCTRCHVTTGFRDVQGVAIHQRTSFPLTGAHLQITCEACHQDEQGGAFSPLPTTCVACHLKDYQTAQSVDHVAENFPTTCEQCHTTVSFAHNAVFDHVTASGGYPLVAAHARLRCTSCHDASTRSLIFHPSGPNDCITCHQPEYQRGHNGQAFPTTCVDCHNQDTWSGASFDHNKVANFALVGAHTSLACAACHAPQTFALLFPSPSNQNDCYACHETDYQREHSGTGFPTTCLTCHTVDSWSGATFTDHDAQFFPIYSGAHQGRWSTCQTCHTTASDYHQFTCFQCHEHDQSRMDSAHQDVPNYVYDSQQCYSCHPRGRSR